METKYLMRLLGGCKHYGGPELIFLRVSLIFNGLSVLKEFKTLSSFLIKDGENNDVWSK
jgi:hypothetical protein